MVKRIVEDLKRRKYKIWFDLDCMKGSVIDAMSEAVEGAEVMLYGVCEQYRLRIRSTATKILDGLSFPVFSEIELPCI